jgi:hypothetical protein
MRYNQRFKRESSKRSFIVFCFHCSKEIHQDDDVETGWAHVNDGAVSCDGTMGTVATPSYKSKEAK